MSTIATTIRLRPDVKRALNQAIIPPLNQTYIIDQALRHYLGMDTTAAIPIAGPKPPSMPNKVKSKQFVRPSKLELSDYFYNKGCIQEPEEQAQAFMDHYDSNGWRIGGKTPMKSWQAAVRNWLRGKKQRETNKRGYQDDKNKSAAQKLYEARAAQQHGAANAGSSMDQAGRGLWTHVHQGPPGRTNPGMGDIIDGAYTAASRPRD